MDEDTLQRTCRTCLKNNGKILPIIKVANNTKPLKTYGQLLKEYAQFEFATEQEKQMPQGLCIICCRQLRTINKFISHAKECNERLMIMAMNNSDCLEEQAIDLPAEEDSHAKKEYDRSDDDISTDDNLKNDQESDNNLDVENTHQCESTAVALKEEDVVNPMKPETDEVHLPAGFDINEFSMLSKARSKLHVTCPICSKLLKKAYLVKHLHKMHGIHHPSTFLKKQQQMALNANDTDSRKVFKCKQCDYIAKTKAGFTYHNRTKHATEKDKFQCKFCEFGSFKKLELVRHIKDEHKAKFKALKKNAEKKQEIGDAGHGQESAGDSCDENTFETVPVDSSDDDEFIKEMITVDRRILKAKYIDGKPYNSLARKCDECGKVYKDLPSLYAHKRFVHISEDRYSVCVHCGKKYKRNKDMRNHILQVHPNEVPTDSLHPPEVQEKRFICTECPYATTTTTHLKLHIRRHHTGEKPYVCEICGNSFLTAYDLKKHRYIHTGEKPYKCPMCPKTFRVSSKLTKHKRVHTGERPFKCAECGKGFTQEYNLSVHKRTHAKEQKTSLPVQW